MKHWMTAVVLMLAGASAQAAPLVLGNYTLYGLPDTVTRFTGTGMYDGSGYANPLSEPGPVTDDSALTFYATVPYAGYDAVSLGLGFSDGGVLNGPGDDLLFLFTWDQTGNDIALTINGTTRALSLQTLYGCGSPTTQCVLDGMQWMGNTYDNNQLLVGLADLSDFGLGPGATLPGDLELSLTQGGSNSIVFNLAGTLHEMTPVPVPAAFWLMASGLGVLGAWRRRR